MPIQAFVQALLAVAVFGIKTEFSGQGAYLQECCELQGLGQGPIKFAILCI